VGRVQAFVKFSVEKVLDDGSYLSWIAPDGKSQKKGGTKIQVRVIEYTIDTLCRATDLSSDYQFNGHRSVSGFIASFSLSSALGKAKILLMNLKPI